MKLEECVLDEGSYNVFERFIVDYNFTVFL